MNKSSYIHELQDISCPHCNKHYVGYSNDTNTRPSDVLKVEFLDSPRGPLRFSKTTCRHCHKVFTIYKVNSDEFIIGLEEFDPYHYEEVSHHEHPCIDEIFKVPKSENAARKKYTFGEDYRDTETCDDEICDDEESYILKLPFKPCQHIVRKDTFGKHVDCEFKGLYFENGQTYIICQDKEFDFRDVEHMLPISKIGESIFLPEEADYYDDDDD